MSSQSRASRTFMDYDSISQAMDGLCGLYEKKLKELNPANRNITYDITDLYNFMDGLADLSALVGYGYVPVANSCMLREFCSPWYLTDAQSCIPGYGYDHSIQAYLPYDRQWIKQRTFQHLKKLAH